MSLFTGQDETLVCIDCTPPNNTFVFTQGEQKFYEEKGFTDKPKRCPMHRAAKKAARQVRDASMAPQPSCPQPSYGNGTGNGRGGYNGVSEQPRRGGNGGRRHDGGGRRRRNDDDSYGNY